MQIRISMRLLSVVGCQPNTRVMFHIPVELSLLEEDVGSKLATFHQGNTLR